MIQIKKTMIALALLTVTGFAGAQNKPQHNGARAGQMKNMSPSERGAFEAEKAAGKLGLTPEQKQSWQIAATERVAANQPIKQKLESSTTPEEKEKLRAEMRQNQVAFNKKVYAFLNDDQKKKYEAGKRHMKDARKGQSGAHGQHYKGNKG